MSPSLRITLLTETFAPELGGGERQAALLANGFARRGHTVTLITRRSRHASARTESTGAVRVLRTPPAGHGRWKKWALPFGALPALLRQRRDTDVLLVCGFRVLGAPVLLVRAQHSICVLKADSNGELSGEFFRAGLASLRLSPDRPSVRTALAARNRILQRADAFVALSSGIEQEFLKAGVPPERVHRIPNGIDLDLFRPARAEQKHALRARLGLPAGFIALYTGRLVSYKGLPLLLRVWHHHTARSPATLVLAGEGGADVHACEDALRAYVAQHGLHDRVRFAGPVNNVHDWLRAADAFVFPTEEEAFGISLVEAMACGLPCITTNAGGVSDIVTDGVDALVVPPGDADALDRALTRVETEPRLATALAQAACTSAQRYGSDAVIDAWVALFEALLRARRSARS